MYIIYYNIFSPHDDYTTGTWQVRVKHRNQCHYVGVFHTAIYLELLDIELNFAALPPCGSAPAAMRRLTPRSGIFVAPRGGAARWMPVRHRQSIALGQV